MLDDIVVRAKYCREWGNFDEMHGLLLAEVERVREELAGAQQTIAHQCAAMGWIAGHDRQGRDHAEEMLVASAERDAAEGELECVRDALIGLLRRWNAALAGDLGSSYSTLVDHIAAVEDILRGAQ